MDATTALLFISTFSVMMLSAAMVAVFVILGINDYDDAFGYFKVFDSNRKVGGIRFIKLGRLNLSISVSKR